MESAGAGYGCVAPWYVSHEQELREERAKMAHFEALKLEVDFPPRSNPHDLWTSSKTLNNILDHVI